MAIHGVTYKGHDAIGGIKMILQVKHLKSGKSVIIDNEGQIQGKVKVTGEDPFKSIINDFFNKDIQIRYKDMLTSLSCILPSDCIIKNDNGVREVYKASDKYLNEYFIPIFCSLHGYEVSTTNFNG